MKMTILAFGIARDLMNGSVKELEVSEGIKVSGLREALESAFPGLATLRSYMIAVNNEYAENDQTLHAGAEIAIIPPVSGG